MNNPTDNPVIHYTHCDACGKRIKELNACNWNDQTLGIECWKKIALPEIKKQEQQEYEERAWGWFQEDYTLVEMLRVKDLSRIRSEFKLSFINSLIEQFDEKGFLTQRQKQLLNGTHRWNGHFYDEGMLNDTDQFNEAVILYTIGNEANRELAKRYASAWLVEREDEFYEAIGERKEA